MLRLAPLAATCAAIGQLAQVLVLLGHAPDAALLQQRLAALAAAQAEAAADVMAHPPPALAMALPWPQQQALAASAGPAVAAAVAASLAEMPGPELRQRVEAAEAAQRGAHWKWAILREPERGDGDSGSGGPSTHA